MSAKTLSLPRQEVQEKTAVPWPKLARLFWLGLIAAAAGAAIETVFMLLTRQRLMNRSGLLYGQLSLVWGLGAVLFTALLSRLRSRGLGAVFLGGAVLGTGLEFLCSWFQEYALGMVFWDYSHLPLSIGGRVNLLFSLFWGGAATLWVCLILPWVDRLLDRFPLGWRRGVTLCLATLLAMDMGLTTAALRRMEARQRQEPPRSSVEEFLDRTYPDQRLYHRFTDMAYAGDYILEHPNFHQ